MKQNLNVYRNGVLHSYKFNTITEAYHFYLENYSSIGEWWYYLRIAHKRLKKVTDEEVMKSIFVNVFDNVVLFEDRLGD